MPGMKLRENKHQFFSVLFQLNTVYYRVDMRKTYLAALVKLILLNEKDNILMLFLNNKMNELYKTYYFKKFITLFISVNFYFNWISFKIIDF